jgi:putative acetyltransferase
MLHSEGLNAVLQEAQQPESAWKEHMSSVNYPDAVDPDLVGTYSPLAKAGGGYVWDDVLEYRVWCHPERGAFDHEEGSDYYHAFATYAEAFAFYQTTHGAEEPLALIRQVEYHR